MTITQKKFNSFLEKLSKEFDLDIENVKKFSTEMMTSEVSTITSAAKKLAEELKVDITKITPSGSKISVDDIREAAGQKRKAKKTDLFTPKARDLAKENDLKESDFKESERTGNPRKSGEKTITIQDVNRKLGIVSKSAIVSPTALKLAEDNNVDLTKVVGTGNGGRIKISDIKSYIENIDDGESSSESEDEE